MFALFYDKKWQEDYRYVKPRFDLLEQMKLFSNASTELLKH